MKNLMLLSLLICSTIVRAQNVLLTAKGFVDSKDSTKNYVIVDVPGVKSIDLYSKAATYLNKTYDRPREGLKAVYGKSIVFSHTFDALRGDVEYYTYRLKYHLSLEFKDGKVKIEPVIENILEDPSPSQIRKVWIADQDSPNKNEVHSIFFLGQKDGLYHVSNDQLKVSLEQWANGYIKNLQKAVVDNW